MALTGELSDLSLAELIEFFCNQRKSGRLKVVYPMGDGFFYLKSGSVVHARFGDLRGIEAVYYALTLPNASFKFSPAFEPPEHTINQPWTSVVLEGLRRMDEGISPSAPVTGENATEEKPAEDDEVKASEPVNSVPEEGKEAPTVPEYDDAAPKAKETSGPDVQSFGVLLSQNEQTPFVARRGWNTASILGAVGLLIAVVAVPWGWYVHSKAARLANEANKPAEEAQALTPTAPAEPTTVKTENETKPAPASPDAAQTETKAQRDARAKERARVLMQASTNAENGTGPAPNATAPVSKPVTPKNDGGNAKKVTVQVSYDENGRVTAASGGDATALRIARQKRFPPGKPGSATVTIPIN